MKKLIEIDLDTMTEITRENLIDSYRFIEDEDDDLRNAFDLVISFYSTPDEYKQWCEEKIDLIGNKK